MNKLTNKFKEEFDKNHPHKPWERFKDISADVAIKFGNFLNDEGLKSCNDNIIGNWQYTDNRKRRKNTFTTEELFEIFINEHYE